MRRSPIDIWRNQKKNYLFLGKRGKLLSFSCVSQTRQALVSLAPYWVGLIEFSAGKKTIGQVIALKREPRIGDKVLGVMRRVMPPSREGIIEYGVKFKIIS